MKFNLAFRCVYSFICFLVLTANVPAMAGVATKQETEQGTKNYQSSFDDYKPLSEDNLSDWKSISVPSNGGGHAGHSMAGMEHEMTPEQMAKMPSDSKKMPAMEGMDHSGMEGKGKAAPDNIKGMDRRQMKPEQTMAPMAGMDHSKMVGMEHGKMKPMTDNKPVMQPMKKENMPQMNHDEMAGHDHGGSDMKAMDHSKMSELKKAEPQPNDMRPSQEDAVQDESQPHEHASTEAPEHAGMTMPTSATAMQASATQATTLQITPNFHPIVVHFPIALTIVAFLLSIAAYVRRSHPVSAQLAAAGHFTLWLAAISAAVAVLLGWLAFNSVNHDDAGHAAMLLHRSWAIPTAIGLILLSCWDAWKYRVNELISVPMLFLLFLLSQAIAVTGWLGGEVVYRHGIGVLSLPSNEISAHGQHHKHGGKDAAEHAHGMSENMANKNAGERTEYPSDEKGESHGH